MYNTVYGRIHSKLFTICHVSWDTLYKYTKQEKNEKFIKKKRLQELVIIIFNSSMKEVRSK